MMGAVKVGPGATLYLNSSDTMDGSLLTSIAEPTIAGLFALQYDPEVFDQNRFSDVTQYFPYLFSFNKENATNSVEAQRRRGAQIAELIASPIQVGSFTLHVMPVAHCVDCKAMIHASGLAMGHHKCGECRTACFQKSVAHRVLDQEVINTFEPRTVVSMTATTDVQAMIDSVIRPAVHGGLPMTETQIQCPLKECEQRNFKNTLGPNDTFMFHRNLGGKGINKTVLSAIVKAAGGRVVKGAAKYNITCFTGAKALWKEKSKLTLHSVRLLFALLFDTRKVDPNFFKITNELVKEYGKVPCPHFLDKTFSGQVSAPPFTVSLFSRLLQLYEGDLEKTEIKYGELLKQGKAATTDIMHNIGSSIKKNLNALSSIDYLDLAGMQGSDGLKRNLSQFKFSGLRNISAGYKKTVVPFLTSEGKEHQGEVEALFSSFAEISFISNSKSLQMQQDRHWQVRLHLACFLYKEALRALFSKEQLLDFKFLGLPVHYVTAHIADEYEKRPLIWVSTEWSEAVFKLLNQLSTNCHKRDVLLRWLHGVFALRMKRHVTPPSCSGKGNSHLYNYKEEKEWEEVVLKNNAQTRALVAKLEKRGFEEGDHWRMEGEKIVFPFPSTTAAKAKNKEDH